MRIFSGTVFFVLFVRSAFAGLAWETTYREIRVPAGQKEVLADFGFKNGSSSLVEISSLQTSCGCTVAKVDKKQIAPGEAAAVHVRFEIGNRKGEQVKSVVVRTSDHTKQILTLRVLIQDSISFSQKEFVWTSGASPTPKESIIEVSPNAQILGVESLNDRFDAKLEEMGLERRYRLVVSPRSTAVPVDTSVKVLVTDPKKRSIFLQARVED